MSKNATVANMDYLNRMQMAVTRETKRCEFTVHRASDHTNAAFSRLNMMRKSGDLCDIELLVGEVKVSGHKVVLSACSPYFHAMFTNEMLERYSPEVTIHDIDAYALELLVDFAYTAEITINENNVQVLLPAASLLQLNSVREACCNFLLKQLHPTNCLGIKSFADTHSCEELLKMSTQFSLQNFIDVCDTEEYLLLPKSEVLELMKSEDVCITSEEQVYNSAIKWIKYDMDNRQQFAGELLNFVRIPLLSRTFLMTHVEGETIVRSDSKCKDLLIEAMKFQLLPEQRNQMESHRSRQRQPKALKPALFCVGGGSLFSIHSDCECYDPATDSWMQIASMTSRRSRTGVCTVGRKLYAVGGYDGASDLASAECYNPQENKWTKISPMGTKRSCLGVTAWNDMLYAGGGYDGASCLSSVERYDPLTETWSSVAAMLTRRRYLKFATLDDCIFAIGGYDGTSHLSSVEKYDPQTNKWTVMPNMICRRSNAAVVVMDGMLYVCGGSDGSTCLSSMERFNPRRFMWETMASMYSRRSTHDAVVMNGQLYAAGGNDGSSSLNTTEKYDPKTNRWELIMPMNLRRSSVGASVIRVMNLRKILQNENQEPPPT